MACRYDRAFSPGALASILPGGPFRFLVTDLPRYKNDPFCLDLQLREKNTLMYYRGTTRLLTVQIRENGGLRAVADADKAYGRYPLCGGEYARMMRPWESSEANGMELAFRAYLEKAHEACQVRYYCEGTEGYWQNRLCIEWGFRWTPDQPFLVIDRECVIGFDSKKEQREYYDPLLQPYAEIRNRLQAEAEKEWGKPGGKSFGDELDLLALDRQGNLVVIELKHGGNASGIYWGPLQALAYRDIFQKKMTEITPGLKELVRQKVALGLLPREAQDWLPQGNFAGLKTVLAVGNPKVKSRCWGKLEQVVKQMDVTTQIEDVDEMRLIRLE